MATRYKGGWRERVTVGYAPDGRVIEKAIYGKTKVELGRKAADFKAGKDAGLALVSSEITVATLMEMWLETVIKPNRAIRTYADYSLIYQAHIRKQLGRRVSKDLTLLECQAWINRLSANLQPSTVRTIRGVLRAALNYGIKGRLLSFNPAALVEMPKNQREEVGILQPADVVRLLRHTENTYPWGALFHMAVMTGMRLSELRGLVWDDVDFERGVIKLHRTLQWTLDMKQSRGNVWQFTSLKTKGSRARIEVTRDTVEVLRGHQVREQEWLDQTQLDTEWTACGLLFVSPNSGKPLLTSTIGERLDRYVAECGLPRIKFHSLRHTYAALLVAADVNPKVIQDAMRHASITTTLNTYGHLMESARSDRNQKLTGLLARSGAWE